MVGLFMILAYGKLGLVADAGLFVFSVLTLALYKLIPVNPSRNCRIYVIDWDGSRQQYINF